MTSLDPFAARTNLETASGPVSIYRLERLAELGLADLERLPYAIRIWLESLLRQVNGREVTEEHVESLARWDAKAPGSAELPFKPARVILQDFTGVPAVVDLAALRSAMQRLGGDPGRINPHMPVDLVIDHSVQVDMFGSNAALYFNAQREFERNRERYEFLHWAQNAFDNFRVVPPATGIVHQVNLEYLATVVARRQAPDGTWVAFPDTLVGTDSHTTMINGLGVMGWGVGGIEAEAVMLGEPITMLPPQVVGFELVGELPEGATATDLVLVVTQMLRQKGVVGKFVEFYGPGVSRLSLPDRATIANMSPEYGATMGFFPVDAETLRYLGSTARAAELVDLVERYTKAQGLFRSDEAPVPVHSDALTLDLGTVQPSLAGPKRPQDRIPLAEMKPAFEAALRAPIAQRGFALDESEITRTVPVGQGRCQGQRGILPKLGHGAVVIAAITSCTNTSNPTVMIGAGLLAKKAVERGLRVPSYVKTSLAPGSTVVTRYLEAAGLTPYLDQLGFNLVGYGCTTCIGNSGPLPEDVARAVEEGDPSSPSGQGLVAAAVLSGNRNFEGRINPHVQANYLASPPLVVAYALAGSVDVDLLNEPLGHDLDGQPVYLRDIWPSQAEIQAAVEAALDPRMFEEQYADVFSGNETWNNIPAAESAELYRWDPASTYIQEPPFFGGLTPKAPPPVDIRGARVLALLGDSVTTDHISPAGSIAADSPAGRYLVEHGVERRDFNSYGSRRGNHEVMMRGTLANIRLKNLLLPGTEGGVTVHLPGGEEMSIYDAAMRYQAEGTPLVVLAGKEYGTGSSRDWAAKGVLLQGVKAVVARSYERIHRSNLVGMGVLPLQFEAGESVEALGLTGREMFDITGIENGLQPGQQVTVRARRDDGSEITFAALARLDTPVEVEYYRNGGVLHTILRRMAHKT
jgi:aconitate hydratase